MFEWVDKETQKPIPGGTVLVGKRVHGVPCMWLGTMTSTETFRLYDDGSPLDPGAWTHWLAVPGLPGPYFEYAAEVEFTRLAALGDQYARLLGYLKQKFEVEQGELGQ